MYYVFVTLHLGLKQREAGNTETDALKWDAGMLEDRLKNMNFLITFILATLFFQQLYQGSQQNISLYIHVTIQTF